MDNRDYLTISEFNFYISNIISSEELLSNVYLIGEVSGLSLTKDTAYFTIKDENSQLSVICFNVSKTYIPQNGEQVLIKGNPDFYSKLGKFSFKVYAIEPIGLGKLFKELELLKQKLLDEGLFEESRKKALPQYPQNIVLVTSISGAVVQDMLSTIRAVNTIMDITIIDVRVQGVQAVTDIVRGLKLADTQNFDCIILARGGGSFEDLLPFNTEDVARCIANLKTPIISAIGHETDISLSDFVADKRALTPTAAAKIIVFDQEELKKEIIDIVFDMQSKAKEKYNKLSNDIKNIAHNLSAIASDKLHQLKDRIYRSNTELSKKVNTLFSQLEYKIKYSINRLNDINPTKILSKGYFKIAHKDKQLTDINELKKDDIITIYSNNGTAKAQVLDVKEEGN